MKGIIALDIDGTAAEKGKAIHPKLALFLKGLKEEGWAIYFVTGRTLSFAKHAFAFLDFPFYLALQNGADIIEYPSKKLLYRSYLPSDLAHFVEPFCSFVIYSGFETGDFCYYLSTAFSEDEQEYLKKLKALSEGEWVSLSSFSDLRLQKEVPLIKAFGKKEKLESVAEQIKGYSVSVIQDTVDPTLHILLLTSKEADKGIAVEHLKTLLSVKSHHKVIVAGDDYNDLPMLKKGDEAIVMEGAPSDLFSFATLIAPPPEKEGLIEALKKATSS